MKEREIRSVSVDISGMRISAEGVKEPISFRGSGSMRQVLGKWQVLCELAGPDEGAGSRFHLTVDKETVRVARKDGVEADFCFQEEVFSDCRYRTPYGELFFQIRTERLRILCGTDGLYADINYRLYAEDACLSENEMHISVRDE
jgi:uncharacterized beta-barrel protein YwiB (DUF1934 family)